MEIFIPGYKYFNAVEIFLHRLKYVHPVIYFYLGGNISIPVEIFSRRWELNFFMMSYVGNRRYFIAYDVFVVLLKVVINKNIKNIFVMI